MRPILANAEAKNVLVIMVKNKGGNVMKKLLGLITISAFLSAGPVALAAATTATSETPNVVDVGNKMCPVSGEEVTGKHFVEHNGKRYGLCCPMCANKFKRDPEKYLKQMASGSTAKSHNHQH